MNTYPGRESVSTLLGHIDAADRIASEIVKACRASGYNRHALEFSRLRCQLAEAGSVIFLIAATLESEGPP